jgi:hypothetical protein
MNRVKLPNRRCNRTIRVQWGQHQFHVTIGLDIHTAAPTEVFYSDGMKSGTDLLHTAQDACVLLSQLLQHGATIGEIGKSLSSAGMIGAIALAVSADCEFCE